jgi:hypothetical protein
LVEAVLLEGHLADVVAGALEGLHCTLEVLEIFPGHQDLADDGANDSQGDQTFGFTVGYCFEILHQYIDTLR